MKCTKEIIIALCYLFFSSSLSAQYTNGLSKTKSNNYSLLPNQYLEMAVGGNKHSLLVGVSYTYLPNENLGICADITGISFKSPNQPSDYRPNSNILGTEKNNIRDGATFYSVLLTKGGVIKKSKISYTLKLGPSFTTYAINYFKPYYERGGLFYYPTNYTYYQEDNNSMGLTTIGSIYGKLSKKLLLGLSTYSNINKNDNFLAGELNLLFILHKRK